MLSRLPPEAAPKLVLPASQLVLPEHELRRDNSDEALAGTTAPPRWVATGRLTRLGTMLHSSKGGG